MSDSLSFKMIGSSEFTIIQLLLQISRQIMREGVLPLNILVACFYIVIAAATGFVLKKSSRPLQKMEKVTEKEREQKWKESINYNKLLGVSWLKKYTLVGTFLHEDKKYLLKEFLFIAAYSVTCLQINHIILWPVTYTLFLLPILFTLFDLVCKKIQPQQAEKVQSHPNSSNKKINAIKNQGQSEIEIDTVNIDTIPAISSEPFQTIQAKEDAKQIKRVKRSIIQLIINCSVGFSSIIMLYQTVMILTNSTSNSGQLNITSVLIIFCIDQFTIRPAVGLIMFITIKIAEKITGQSLLESLFVSSLLQEELREVIAKFYQEQKRKELEMTASPPRKKQESPSRVPKAALPNSGEHPTYLNLINLQPTRRKTEQQEEQEVASGIEQLYLTTLEQQLFGDGEQFKCGGSTKRKDNKENKEHSYLSAVQKFTIEEQDCDDADAVQQDPLQECTLNRVNPFSYDFSPINYTKRRAVPIRKKHKRVLNLTGSSPYLEYLPDMLKNVDKFKQVAPCKQNRML